MSYYNAIGKAGIKHLFPLAPTEKCPYHREKMIYYFKIIISISIQKLYWCIVSCTVILFLFDCSMYARDVDLDVEVRLCYGICQHLCLHWTIYCRNFSIIQCHTYFKDMENTYSDTDL